MVSEIVADAGEVVVRRVIVSPAWHTNCYLLTARGTGSRVLIDAAAEPNLIEAMLVESVADVHESSRAGTAGPPGVAGLPSVAAITTTHRHHDHLGALATLAAATGARTVAGRPDAAAITAATGVTISDPVWTSDTVRAPGITLEVIGIPGHTPGSIVPVLRGSDGRPTHLFVGDDLFPGGVGKTNSRADFTALYSGVTELLFNGFGDDTVVWPGHGLPTTLGAERPHLAAWRARGW